MNQIQECPNNVEIHAPRHAPSYEKVIDKYTKPALEMCKTTSPT